MIFEEILSLPKRAPQVTRTIDYLRAEQRGMTPKSWAGEPEKIKLRGLLREVTIELDYHLRDFCVVLTARLPVTDVITDLPEPVFSANRYAADTAPPFNWAVDRLLQGMLLHELSEGLWYDGTYLNHPHPERRTK
jgi:hypothetical protein